LNGVRRCRPLNVGVENQSKNLLAWVRLNQPDTELIQHTIVAFAVKDAKRRIGLIFEPHKLENSIAIVSALNEK
jgi:hypothetical protein